MCLLRYTAVLAAVACLSLLCAATSLSRTWYINIDHTGDAPTIQAAADSAAPGDTILVAPGHYTWTNQGGSDHAMLFFPAQHGGFTLRSQGGPEVTILDAERGGRVIFLQGYNYITIEGFTIANGDAPAYGDSIGGGVVAHISNGDVIRDCIFVNNTAEVGGGFVAVSQCDTRVENCVFKSNYAYRFGGGVCVGYSQTLLTISGCTIIDNTSAQYGGGIGLSRSNILVENTVIAGNTAGTFGGGLYAKDTRSATFRGVTISENSAPEGAGVFLTTDARLTLDRSIVAFSTGDGLILDPTVKLKLGCTDVFGNEGGDEWPEWVTDLGGNFSADPLFCGDPGSRIYTLHADSPCLPGFHPDGHDCGVVGALGADCGNVSVTPTTWGRIKLLY